MVKFTCVSLKHDI